MSITLHTAPLDSDVRELLLARGGKREPQAYQSVQWDLPEGTTRNQVGGGTMMTFYSIRLPDTHELLEIHVEPLGLSMLFDVDPHIMADSEEAPPQLI